MLDLLIVDQGPVNSVLLILVAETKIMYKNEVDLLRKDRFHHHISSQNIFGTKEEELH